jgi:hypothetical protein
MMAIIKTADEYHILGATQLLKNVGVGHAASKLISSTNGR